MIKIIDSAGKIFNKRLRDMESKEKWISKVVETGKNLNDLNPNPFLFSKIRNKIENQGNNIVSLGQVRLVFTFAVVLIIFNFLLLKNLVATDSEEVRSNELVENTAIENSATDYAFLDDDFEYQY